MATSPVTVMHAPGRCATLRAPSGSVSARQLRVDAAHLMRAAYCELVRDADTRWKYTDIDEHSTQCAMGLDMVVARSPEQDMLGVTATAIGVMRFVVSDEFLAQHRLDLTTRYHLAAILFAVYKAKAEDAWHFGSRMSMHVLERFVQDHEFDGDWRTSDELRAAHERILWAAEADLVINYPFSLLIDYDVYACFEVALAQLLERGAITEGQSVLGLGIVAFYIHNATANPRRDVLEELGRDRSTDEMGASLAYLVLVSMRLHDGQMETALDLSAVSGFWHYDWDAMRVAACNLVVNAQATVRRRARTGAYAAPETRVHAYVCPSMLSMLRATLSGEVT